VAIFALLLFTPPLMGDQESRDLVRQFGLPFSLAAAAGVILLVTTFVWMLRTSVRARTFELSRRNAQLEGEIRQRQRLEEQLQRSQRLEAMGVLATGVAHDFNNLLLVISAQCSQIRGFSLDEPRLEDSIAMVEAAVSQAKGFTRSLLTFSRSAPTDKSPIDLRATVRVATEMLEHTLQANIEVIVDDRCDPPPRVWGDEAQLQQIVLNLAVNARDAMPEGGELRIGLDRIPADGAGEATEMARLTVTDTGGGIPEEIYERIFEPFFTTKSRGRGTGLGLAFVHATVEEHQGSIEVRSGRGGSTFEILLPVTNQPLPPPVEAPHAAAQGQGECVLLVEDDQQVREVLASYLVLRGYDVLQAIDGQACLAEVERHGDSIQLLIVDVDLPKLSGIEALHKMRKRGIAMPAIVMTGGPQPATKELPSAVTILSKPFQLAELGKTAAALLGRADLSGSLR